jgi:hypothetical protein
MNPCYNYNREDDDVNRGLNYFRRLCENGQKIIITGTIDPFNNNNHVGNYEEHYGCGNDNDSSQYNGNNSTIFELKGIN